MRKSRFTKGPPVEIRPDEKGGIDEIVARACDMHIERMSTDGWYLGIDDSKGGHWQFWFGAQNYKSAVVFRHTEHSPPEKEKPRSRGRRK